MNVADKQAVADTLQNANVEVTLESLQRMATIVSNEALLPANFLNAFTANVPEFFSRAKRVLVDAINNAWVSDFRKVDSGKLVHATKNIPYLNLVDMQVPTPAGLSVCYKEYLSHLEDAQTQVDRLFEETLKPLQRHIAILLNDPTRLSSHGSSTGIKFGQFNDEKMRKAFAASFKAGNRVEWSYGELFKRQAELPEVDRQIQNLTGRYMGVDRKKVQKAIADIGEMVDTLIQRVNEEPEAYKFSGPVLKQLVTVVNEAARQVEFYSLQGFYLRALTEAVADGYEKMVTEIG